MGIAGALGAAVLASACLTGCANLGYYWQSMTGHLGLMSASRPVEEWLSREETPQLLRRKLLLAQEIRDYASRELKLPDNPSYRRYADLRRRAAVWNVTAAPAFSLELKKWCFPVTGCVSYRGYYDEAKARAEAQALAAQGLEASAYPVTAYSTLGYLNWLGGDPLLNTFIGYPDGELARILFHELAHQVVYAKNDTMFNESFATAVERLGIQRWMRDHASEPARREYEAFDARRRQFRALSRATRERLTAVYEAPDLTAAQREQGKQRVMEQFRAEYARMKERSAIDPALWRGYDRWVREANNAFFGAQAVYDELIPGFEALFRSQGGDWQAFYDATRQLAALPKEERHRQLKEAAGG